MSIVDVPSYYENENNVIEKAGEYIKKVGNNAIIIAGNRALLSVKEKLFLSLKENNINYKVIEFSGYPTVKKVNDHSKEVLDNNVNVIIGIGGGKVLDLAKAIGNKTKIPIVTIPTIPATCAAWSSLSVLYKDNGEEDIYVNLERAPKLIIADKNILTKAPIRYINSGVADTIVKWYEISPDLKENKNNFCLRLQLKICELAEEFLLEDYINSYKTGTFTKEKHILNNAIDSIIMLAGLSGSIKGSVPYGGLAHPFYNASTYVKDTHIRLHGEIVIFGLLVQFKLENRSDEKILEFMKWMKELELPITLKDLGINEDIEEKVKLISIKMKEWVGEYKNLDYELTWKLIEKAIIAVDAIGRKLRGDENATN